MEDANKICIELSAHWVSMRGQMRLSPGATDFWMGRDPVFITADGFEPWDDDPVAFADDHEDIAMHLFDADAEVWKTDDPRFVSFNIEEDKDTKAALRACTSIRLSGDAKFQKMDDFVAKYKCRVDIFEANVQPRQRFDRHYIDAAGDGVGIFHVSGAEKNCVLEQTIQLPPGEKYDPSKIIFKVLRYYDPLYDHTGAICGIEFTDELECIDYKGGILEHSYWDCCSGEQPVGHVVLRRHDISFLFAAACAIQRWRKCVVAKRLAASMRSSKRVVAKGAAVSSKAGAEAMATQAISSDHGSDMNRSVAKRKKHTVVDSEAKCRQVIHKRRKQSGFNSDQTVAQEPEHLYLPTDPVGALAQPILATDPKTKKKTA